MHACAHFAFIFFKCTPPLSRAPLARLDACRMHKAATARVASYKDSRVVPCDQCPFLRPYSTGRHGGGGFPHRILAAEEEATAGPSAISVLNATTTRPSTRPGAARNIERESEGGSAAGPVGRLNGALAAVLRAGSEESGPLGERGATVAEAQKKDAAFDAEEAVRRALRERLTSEVAAYKRATSGGSGVLSEARRVGPLNRLNESTKLRLFRTPEELRARGILSEEEVAAKSLPFVHPGERARKAHLAAKMASLERRRVETARAAPA